MTEQTKIVELANCFTEESRRRKVEDMKKLMLAVSDAEAHAPESRVDDVVNDLVEFMLELTREDCVNFSRKVRQVMDDLVDARSTHKDEYLNTFLDRRSEELTEHQILIRSIQRDRDAMDGKLGNDVYNAIKNAGFEPRGVTKPEIEPVITGSDVEAPDTIPDQNFERRLAALESTVLNDLALIKELLAKRA